MRANDGDFELEIRLAGKPAGSGRIVASAEKALAITAPGEQIKRLSAAIARLGDRGHRTAARRFARHLDELVSGRMGLNALRDVAKAYMAAGRPADARTTFRDSIERAAKSKSRDTDLFIIRLDLVGTEFDDLLDDLTPDERRQRQHWDAVRRAEAAIASGNHLAATEDILAAERATDGLYERWEQTRIFDLYAKAGDRRSALRIFQSIPAGDRALPIVGPSLVRLNLHKLISGVAAAEVQRELAYAASMALPNYHHPAGAIAAVAHFLLDHNKADLARKHLVAAMKAAQSWRLQGTGWTEAAVYAQLGGAIARLDGMDAACPVLNRAAEAADSDHSDEAVTGWLAVLDAYRRAGAWDEALAAAAKLRSSTDRRRQRAKTLALAGRSGELRRLLSTVRTPTEASELAWWIASALEHRRPHSHRRRR